MPDPGRWPLAGTGPVPVTGRLRFSNAEACLRAALAGFGIARLPDFVAESALARGDLVAILAEYEPPAIPVHIVYPPGRHLAGKVRVMVDDLALAFGRAKIPASSL